MTEEIRAPKRHISPPQRVTTAFLERRWVTLLAELILIVAGILIALYIDGWVQDRQDRDKEIAYLELLRDDLDLIEAELTEYVEFENSVLATGKAFLDAISTEDSSGDQRQLQVMLGAMSIRRTLSVDSAAYTDLTSTGNLQLIRSPELRRDLIQYFHGIERSELVVEKNSKQYVDEIFVRFLMDAGITTRSDDSVLAPITDSNALLLDTIGPDFSWPRDVILRQPRSASSWDDMRRQALYRMSIAASGSIVGESMIDSTLQMREHIEEELRRRDTV